MTRNRSFLAAGVALLCCQTTLAGPVGLNSQARPNRPNIVLLLADDMGYSDLGCYGSEIATPNLDRLAARGLRFTQFYNGARCCPTRAALLTGLYAHQAGVGHMVENKGMPAYQGYLNDRCVTLAEVLRRAGYRTLMAGKWHVGQKRPHWPTDRGFQRYFGLIDGSSNYFHLSPGRQMALDDKPYTPKKDGFYMTDALTDYALKFLDQTGRGKEPFFLYVPFTSPHWPLHARPADIARYRGKYKRGWDQLRQQRHRRMIQKGLVEAKWPLTPRDPKAPSWKNVKDKDKADLKMAIYAAQIDRMDQNIGRLLKKLAQQQDRFENTLVLFLSDNGGCAEEIHRGKAKAILGTADSFDSYGLPWANASNTPFRLYKHWVHEGGISTPLIAHWPAVIRKGKKGGTLTHQPGHIIDVMATCLDVAGVPYPATYKGHKLIPLEGKSLVPIFRGRKRAGHAELFWEHEGNRAVRQGRWKLVARHKGAWELFDLDADRTETNDLAAKHPEKVKELSAKYAAWARRCGVLPWPVKKKQTN